MQISFASSMTSQLGMESLGMAFMPLMAMIIGLQLESYVGVPVGIFIGAFMISTLFSGLVALGFPTASQDIAMGVFLICVISLSSNAERIMGFLGQRLRTAKQ